VQLTSDNGIAIITINNPSRHALSPGVPEGISMLWTQIAQNTSFKATVLIGGAALLSRRGTTLKNSAR